MTQELLSAPQVATLIGKSRRTVLLYAEQGRISHTHKMPGGTGAYLFSPEDVDAYQAAQSAGKTEGAA